MFDIPSSVRQKNSKYRFPQDMCFTVLSWFLGWGYLVLQVDGACLIRAYLYRRIFADNFFLLDYFLFICTKKTAKVAWDKYKWF